MVTTHVYIAISTENMQLYTSERNIKLHEQAYTQRISTWY